jgi:hypothetical protein
MEEVVSSGLLSQRGSIGSLEAHSYRERMTTLALSFPELARRARHACEPFDPNQLKRWARTGAPGHGGRCAALFVLSVWNPYENKRFDLHEALKVWDDEHLAAFLAWTRKPWWP